MTYPLTFIDLSRQHAKAIVLIRAGWSNDRVARETGYSARHVARLRRKYKRMHVPIPGRLPHDASDSRASA